MGINLKLSTIDESVYTKEEINRYTNEELIDLIHEYNNNLYWELLWIKTKNTVFKVFNTSVNAYNRDKSSEEVFSVLIQAWIHAVKTYDKEKATSYFYKYAIFIMRQQYSRYASRINANKDGKSIRPVYIEDYVHERKANQDNNCSLIYIIEDESSINELNHTEIRIDVENNLNKLKLSMPQAYTYIKEYFYENKTYSIIAENHGVNTVTVQRIVKKGIKELAFYFKMQEKLGI